MHYESRIVGPKFKKEKEKEKEIMEEEGSLKCCCGTPECCESYDTCHCEREVAVQWSSQIEVMSLFERG